MPNRVTRRNNRKRNIDSVCVHYWLVLGRKAPGECEHLQHDKEFARLAAEFRLFGPWEGVRVLPGCGCEFVSLPECAL